MFVKKICVISFDHWNYDEHIVAALQKKGIESVHIKFGGFKQASFSAQVKNTFSKVFLNINPKKKKIQEFILKTLQSLGKQDQILVINPELITKEFHLEIKKHTVRYIAYLYDSVERNPVEHLLDGIFDTIFSFDSNDVKKYHFQKTTNYIYLDKQPLSIMKPKFKAFYLASYDNRLQFLYQIEKKIAELNVSHLFIIVGKQTWKKNLLSFFGNKNKSIIYRRNRINHKNIGDYYSQTNVILDLVRENQTGLSFRVFEAMAYQKKMITNNQSILEYDFYKPKNILVINEKNLDLKSDFFVTDYEPISDEIYNKYTLENWVKNIFNLN